MKSATAKVLHSIGGRSLLGHSLAAAQAIQPHYLSVVVRHGRDQVAAAAHSMAPQAVIADQDDIPGTGRAASCALAALDAQASAAGGAPITGPVVVMNGDVPLIDAGTLAELVDAHVADNNAVTLLTTVLEDPTGYGRIVRDAQLGNVTGIVEHRDATQDQRAIKEVNAGFYVFDAHVLRQGLASLTTHNDQGEMYLTDVLAYAVSQGATARALITEDTWSVEGVNDRQQLSRLGQELNRRIVAAAMLEGVTVVDPASTWIDVDVQLAPDVTLLPGVQLQGTTSIGAGAQIGPDSTLTNCTVHATAQVTRTHAVEATIGEAATVGPFTYLRPGTVLGSRGKIGGFTETKNVIIGEDSKVPHLSYVGDAVIGDGSNIGAGTIVANYDGVAKHRTVIGSHVRIGSHNVLVAPVSVGDGAYTAAGSAITADVPAGALGIARSRPHQVEGWTQRKRPGTDSAQAAAAAQAADNADANGEHMMADG